MWDGLGVRGGVKAGGKAVSNDYRILEDGRLYLKGFILLGPLKSHRHISCEHSLGLSMLSSWFSISGRRPEVHIAAAISWSRVGGWATDQTGPFGTSLSKAQILS